MFARATLFAGCLLLNQNGTTLLPGDQGDIATTNAKRVMVVRGGAELKTGSDVVALGRLGEVLKVTSRQEGWRWVPDKRGWIAEQHVVSLDKAIDHFTQNVDRNASSESYWQRAVAYAALGESKNALKDFDEAVRRDARNLAARNDRGNVHRKLGQFDEALRDFDAVIAAGARHPVVYTNRGLVWHEKGDYDKALADFNAAIGIDDRFAPAWEAGGAAREAKGEYAKAIANYKQAIELEKNFDRAHNNLAWLLATVPDESLRNGEQAIEHARTACDVTGFEEPGFLDTLAAAHAEAAQFEEAVKWSTKAVELADDAQKPAMQKRLELYKFGKPYRESRDKRRDSRASHP